MVPAPPIDSLHYQLVYDVRTSVPGVWFVTIFPFLVFLIGYWAFRQHSSGASSRYFRASLVGVFLMVLGAGGVLVIVGGSVLPDLAMRLAVTRGRYQVFEGLVTNFAAGDRGDHVTETWILETPAGPRTYAYSPSVLGPGYDLTAGHGGAVRDGVHARVADVNGRIVRLELAP